MTGEAALEPFSVPWLEDLALRLRVPAGASFTVQVVVSGGPNGDVATVWRAQEGTIVVTVGTDEFADAVFLVGWNDALAIVDGNLAVPVAYMQGRLKPSGDMELILRLLALSSPASPPSKAV